MKVSPFVKTYVVVAVALGLGAYAYLVESKKEPPSDKPKEKVLVFDKKKAREVSLQPAEGEAVRVARQGEGWTLLTPTAVPADGPEVDTLLSSLEGLESDEVVVENATDLAQYGLAPPRLTVAVQLEGAPEPLQLQLGDKTPDSRGLYARVPAKPRVFLIPAYMQGSFEKKPFDLRDRSVLHVKRDDIQKLDVAGPEGEYTIARAEKGDEWTITRPLSTLAGRWAVDSLLGLLESLRMESVVAEEAKDLKPYGLDKPARMVTLTLKDGSTRRLEVGKETADKKYHVRDASSSRVVLVAPALVEDLAKGLAERRAKRLLEVATYEVVGMEVEAGGGKRVYDRSSQKGKDGVESYQWKRSAPDAKELDTSKVQDVLFLLGGLEVQQFVDTPGEPKAYGLDAPALKASFKYEGARPPATFELAEKEGAFYARRAGDAAVLKIDPAKGAELLKSFKEL
jgi:hypothetical protein